MYVLSISFWWKDILWESFKSYETWKWNLVNVSYNIIMNKQAFIEADMAKKLSDSELIIKLASSGAENLFSEI